MVGLSKQYFYTNENSTDKKKSKRFEINKW